jgi:nucleotide-binding universal stress UspA family protein
MLFKKILFPVDFSDRSEAVAPHVSAARERFRASLTLLHFVHTPPMAYGAPDSPVVFDYPIDEIIQAAEKKLAAFAAKTFPGIPVGILVKEGDPGLSIADLAHNNGIDLIMMPTRGHGLFRSALVGSVTAKTLHDARCAVWTEAHCEHAGERSGEWRSVVCAIDLDDEGARLIRSAAAIAADTGATVRIAHAVPGYDTAAEAYTGTEFTEYLKREARGTIAGMQKEAGTDFGVCVEAGPIVKVLRHAVESHEGDLVVIGRGVLPEFAGRLRSQAYAIVRGMPCPVLSF